MTDRIAEIRARLDRATGGQWMHGVEQGFHWVDTRPDRRAVTIADDVPTDADAELIAHAPDDIRWLLDQVEAVRAIHQPVEIEPSETICRECSLQLPSGRFFGKVVEWPCPTLQALGVES